MKKLSTFIIAAALIFGMAQCKKQEAPVTPEADIHWVQITLKVDGDGGKHIVYPNTGAVVYSNGDQIYVGNGGVYRGVLTYLDGAFTGSLGCNDAHPFNTNDYLHFYFLGGLDVSPSPTPLVTTSLTLDISNQSSKLPVLSYGHSKNHYSGSTITYSCMLENKCALVEFKLAEGTISNVTVNKMHNMANVSFADPAIVPTTNTGTITLNSESATSKWAILLPQDNVTNVSVSFNGVNFTVAQIDAVTVNQYIHGNDAIQINNSNNYYFSVSADSIVHFAPGNLQATCDGYSWSWAFATHQYDYIGNAVGNTKVSNAFPWLDGVGTVDLFGWSGHNTNYENYYGINSSETYVVYSGYFVDWSDKANAANLFDCSDWFMLSKKQWNYVFNGRSNVNNRYAKAVVNGVKGVILLPDNWNSSIYTLNNINDSNALYSGNTITATQWMSFENGGAVFLPAAGYRSGQGVNNTSTDNASQGNYWSKDNVDSQSAYSLSFTSKILGINSQPLHKGSSVRLARVVNVNQ